MTTRDEPWPEGTPAWTDLVTTDRAAALTFYGGLLGWDLVDGGPAVGGYVQASVGGRAVAGLGEAVAGEPVPNASWTTYLAVDDADATIERVVAAGGTVLTPGTDLAGFGRIAVVADPTGGVVGLWQATAHTGAQLVGEPGAMCWNELMTSDLGVAETFYAEIFGYTLEDLAGPGFDYVGLRLDGQTVAGIGAVSEEMSQTPAHWLTYFAVASADEAAERAEALGGALVGEVRDSTYGRMAVLSGPEGERFAVIEPSAPPETLDPDESRLAADSLDA